MRFLSPQWVWMLLVIPLLYAVVAWDEKRRKERFKRFADPALWQTLSPELEPGARLKKGRLGLLALAFVFLALARPQWGSHEETVHLSGLDVMIALDVSNSMNTEDVAPSRIQEAKHLVKTFLDRLGGDRVGVVAFAASSYVACPLTTDLDYVFQTIQTLTPKMISNQGTDIGLAIETAREALERGAQESGSDGPAAASSRAIVLVSDGEDHEDSSDEAARRIKKSGMKFYALGLGTRKGGPIPVRDENGNLVGYKHDRKGQAVVSAFHPDELVRVAAEAGGKYWSVTPGESEVDELLSNIGALNRSDYGERRFMVYEDRFQIPLAIAIFLILLEISLPARRRRTGMMALFLAVGLGIFQGGSARASSLDAYIENQKGLRAYKEGKVEEAAKQFGKAQALDPSSPELQYNEGVVQMQRGDIQSAIRSFNDSARSTISQDDSRGKKLLGSSLYNLGAALARKGDLKGAIQSYVAAIQAAERAKNGDLAQNARKNLELLLKQKKKQEQQNQDQSGKNDQQKDQKNGKGQNKQKDGSNSSGSNSQDSQDSKESQNSKESKNEKQQGGDRRNQSPVYQDPSQSRKNFHSKKLSSDDADRVMEELTNRERELQARLKRKRYGSAQEGTEKDW